MVDLIVDQTYRHKDDDTVWIYKGALVCFYYHHFWNQAGNRQLVVPQSLLNEITAA